MVRERRTAAALELAILGLLKDQDLHGYELKRRLSDQLGFASTVSFGTLYPALARMEAEGLVRAAPTGAAARHIPLTGSLGGELATFRARSAAGRGSRGKKAYAITPAGSLRFDQLLQADLRGYDDDRLFSLRLVFAGFLPAELRLRLLERRRGQLSDRRTQLAGRLQAEPAGSYARLLVEHDLDVIDRDISWLERLMAGEASPRAGRDGPATADAAPAPPPAPCAPPPPPPP